jgi:hypothetical protein
MLSQDCSYRSRCVCVCSLSHNRMLNAYVRMRNSFSEIKPSSDVCSAIAQTIKLLTMAIRSPTHGFRNEQDRP